jgi:hypothetical protein
VELIHCVDRAFQREVGQRGQFAQGTQFKGRPQIFKIWNFFNINNGKFFRFWLKKSVLPMFYPEFAREKILET